MCITKKKKNRVIINSKGVELQISKYQVGKWGRGEYHKLII